MAVDKVFEMGVWSAKVPLRVSGWAAQVIFDTLRDRAAETYANSRFTLVDDPTPMLTLIEGEAVPVIGAETPKGTATEKLQAAILVPHNQV